MELSKSQQEPGLKMDVQGTFRFAPSYLAHFFTLNCDRYLGWKGRRIDSTHWIYKVHIIPLACDVHSEIRIPPQINGLRSYPAPLYLSRMHGL